MSDLLLGGQWVGKFDRLNACIQSPGQWHYRSLLHKYICRWPCVLSVCLDLLFCIKNKEALHYVNQFAKLMSIAEETGILTCTRLNMNKDQLLASTSSHGRKTWHVSANKQHLWTSDHTNNHFINHDHTKYQVWCLFFIHLAWSAVLHDKSLHLRSHVGWCMLWHSGMWFLSFWCGLNVLNHVQHSIALQAWLCCHFAIDTWTCL